MTTPTMSITRADAHWILTGSGFHAPYADLVLDEMAGSGVELTESALRSRMAEPNHRHVQYHPDLQEAALVRRDAIAALQDQLDLTPALVTSNTKGDVFVHLDHEVIDADPAAAIPMADGVLTALGRANVVSISADETALDSLRQGGAVTLAHWIPAIEETEDAELTEDEH